MDQIIIYDSDDGKTKLQVNLKDETVWLTIEQMGLLFQKSRSTINEHILNIFNDNELEKEDSLRKIGNSDFSTKPTNYYNLDVIISVGYRVRSIQGTRFRKWATERIREYLVKGFTMDDDRLKQEGARSRYFEELLQRIRDIRSSERNFYQKVTDIYTTSIDYQKNAELTKTFFAVVQNKMHFAVHGKTAAEMIADRINSDEPLLGLTNFKGNYITTRDIGIAKNYLSEPELKQLNLIVSLFLDFAELQATNGRLMKMQDWIEKLDSFLIISEKEILNDSGKISHKQAMKKAKIEYKKYRKNTDKKCVSDFDKEMKKLVTKVKKNGSN